MEVSGEQGEAPPLPEGWACYFDLRFRHWYYVESSTGSTQWQHPGLLSTEDVPREVPATQSSSSAATGGVAAVTEKPRAGVNNTLPSRLSTTAVCGNGHYLVRYVNPSSDGENNCDKCGRSGIEAPEHVFRCDECNFDLCQACYAPGQMHSTATSSGNAAAQRRAGEEAEDPWADLQRPASGAATDKGTSSQPVPSPPESSPWQKYQPGSYNNSRYDRPPTSTAANGRWQPHVPCLLVEAVETMMDPCNRQPNGKYSGNYVDCTFGRGGHTEKILEYLSEDARLWAFDVDPEAVAEARKLELRDSRFKIIHRPFGDISEVFESIPLDGVLADLGVSSPQLDDRARGFNVSENGPLDLRMNRDQGMPAREWLKTISAAELAWVIYNYGEDNDPVLAERLAEIILAEQNDLGGQILWTTQLSEILRRAKKDINDSNMHPAKLTFQAIRIFLNQEILQLDRVMKGSFERLRHGGRCCIISFKRKESNAIIKFVREHERPDRYLEKMQLEGRMEPARLCELYPLLATDVNYAVKQVCEPVRPSQAEVERNTRCRSSMVHVLKKEERRCPKITHTAALGDVCRRFVEPRALTIFAGAPEEPLAEVAAQPRQEMPAGGQQGRVEEAQPGQEMPAGRQQGRAEEAQPRQDMPAGGQQECPPVQEEEHRANRVWNDFDADKARQGQRMAGGYLALLAGDFVRVLYAGDVEEDGAQWGYGSLDGQPDVIGWFPMSALRQAEQAPV